MFGLLYRDVKTYGRNTTYKMNNMPFCLGAESGVKPASSPSDGLIPTTAPVTHLDKLSTLKTASRSPASVRHRRLSEADS